MVRIAVELTSGAETQANKATVIRATVLGVLTPRCLTDQALSCRPPVKVPRPDRRAPAESTPNRAAAGW
jgi:hypothetical protein